MDLLLRLIERRTILGLACAAAALMIVNRFGGYWLERVDMRLHPPAAVSQPLATDLLKDNEAREAARIRGMHRSVSAELAAARAQGFKVEELQKLADDILAMDSPSYRPVVIERLNKLRMAIPQKKPFTRTAGADDQNRELDDAPVPKQTRRRR
ncbi:MAG: hypothetical protein HY923_03895 [Elusimicrobia bacterium]|nr:hypothetical protein [Elusimicrobiota bacterium]